MDIPTPFPSVPLLPLAALAVPTTLALAALLFPRRAGLASGVAFGLSLVFTLGTSLQMGAFLDAGPVLGVRVDAATSVMLTLVASLGMVVVRYSRTYLEGDPGLVRYLRWLLLTLSAVTALVVTNNLLVVALSWTATSLALHQLLTFFAHRPAALIAAHKKFLVSRLADACLVGSLVLVHADVGSFEFDRIAAWASARPELSLSMEFAAVLLVLAVALKSAQLPFHGWITQVMEAPTPVSALLHAGIVNIGGFVLIRLAPWVDHAPSARLLLVSVGLVSAVGAALVATTRVSVKVALAWSTCAQMGFMLVQCGLGLWSLALLHLVAHSLYKAYAFSSAGSAVDEWKVRAMTRAPPATSPIRLGVVVLVAVGGAMLGVTVLRPFVGFSVAAAYGPSEFVLAGLFGLALVPLLLAATASRGGAAAMAPRLVGVAALYLGWHALAEHLVPEGAASSSALAWGLAALGFAGLFAVKTALQLRPLGRFARALHPWLFAGFYLDELFTRLTFRVWPPPASAPHGRELPSHDSSTALEVRA